MKPIFSAAYLIAASILLLSCHHSSTKTEVIAEELIPVKVIKIQPQLIQSSIHASGQFTTDDVTFLSFKTGGIIDRLLVKEGDAVHRGQLVATLHFTEINSQVQQVKFSYEKALRDYKRYSNLYRDSVTTLEQLQNTKTALDIAEQQLKSIRFNQNYSEIRATANGYVLKKLSNPGEMVNPGDPILQINGAHESNWILKVNVSDGEWSAIKTGYEADVETDALPHQTIKGIVSKKQEAIDPSTGTFTIDILLKGNAGKFIAQGLFGKATIFPSQQVSSWIIPYDALMDWDAGDAFVFVTNNDKTAEKVKVKVASIEKGSVTIQSGLETAKSLIISGSPYLKEGSTIKIL
ncbi:MAG: rane-fusion protein [Segetibacter sp.]|nr:rane-fusion protein [Segetibacter sp.]